MIAEVTRGWETEIRN